MKVKCQMCGQENYHDFIFFDGSSSLRVIESTVLGEKSYFGESTGTVWITCQNEQCFNRVACDVTVKTSNLDFM